MHIYKHCSNKKMILLENTDAKLYCAANNVDFEIKFWIAYMMLL